MSTYIAGASRQQQIPAPHSTKRAQSGHHAPVADRPSTVRTCFAMRPRIVWRFVLPVTALLFTAAAISWGDWQILLGCATSWMATAQAYREFVRVEDGVIYRRGLWRWSNPMRLEALESVELHRVWGIREPYKHLEIDLVTNDGQWMGFSLRWWSQTEDLLRVVAAAALDPVNDASDRRRWRLDVDPETNRRLAAYA